MPKSQNQKMKLLRLMKIFLNDTDKEHTLTLLQIINKLQEDGINVERKTVYSDIDLLRRFGMDIRMNRKRIAEYYLASREFELSELRLLVDAVQSSKFITRSKSQELIRKLEGHASIYDSGKLERDVIVNGRIKTMNESIYSNVDKISEAMHKDIKISFTYFKYDINKHRELRKDGNRYIVSPVFLNWDNENYYLVAWSDEDNGIRHYRVDRMLNIRHTDESSVASKVSIDKAAYANRLFGMFAGEEMTVELEFDVSLVSVVIDRFGKSVRFTSKTDGSFRISVIIEISDVFLGWLFQFGNKVRIISPKPLLDRYRSMLSDVASLYS